MWEYYYRIWDKYHKNIAAIAIFNDEQHGYKPEKYCKEYYGTKITYEYNTYKMLEQSETKLMEQNNPFALVVLASIYAIKSKNNNELRFNFKRQLIILLVSLKWTRERIEKIFLFIDFIISIDEVEKNRIIFNQLEELLTGGEEKMILSWKTSSLAISERNAGVKEGIKEGMEKGKVETALNMLRKNFDSSMIADLTGLSIDKINELKNNKLI